VPNFVAIDQTVAEIWQFFNVSKMAPPPSRILILFYDVNDIASAVQTDAPEKVFYRFLSHQL